MPETENLYEILQVHPSAHPDVIRAAYRRLSLLYHPDRNPSPEATEMMAAINYAYEVLGDPEKRAAYDRRHTEQPRSARPQTTQSNARQKFAYRALKLFISTSRVILKTAISIIVWTIITLIETPYQILIPTVAVASLTAVLWGLTSVITAMSVTIAMPIIWVIGCVWLTFQTAEEWPRGWEVLMFKALLAGTVVAAALALSIRLLGVPNI